MKRKILASFFIVMSVIATSCSGHIGGNSINDDKNYSDESYDESEQERKLTQEQIDLLCNISVNEEKVKEGKLSDWQKEVLNQYDAAMEYLSDKYPSYDFLITYCEQKNLVNSYTTFNFVEKSEDSVYYDMHIDVYEEENGNRYDITDNFYGKIFEDELKDKFVELMQEEFTECTDVTTNISTVAGKEFGENLDIESVMSGEIEMNHNTDFYINAEGMTDTDYADMVARVKEFISEKGICGSYDVKFVNESEEEDVLYMEHFFVK